jgi:diaminohydroxyphosphoribosylaminopyrimidine deaminase/5-amino-6-(5-phosphoribosylamino)uracil reductase
MTLALEIAVCGAGYVSPNPMVGCVIVSREGKKIGQGFHERHGQAHAETNAIDAVKRPSMLNGATVYVTLEPCAHHGSTPPCCEMLAEHPIDRIVIAVKDPTSKVNGKGIAYLREHGVQVDVGLMEKEAQRLNEFFFHFNRYHRPFVTLKMAQTLDGYIAAPDGHSQWITGPEARERVHRWRSHYDAVMIGRHTALNDNPRLTVRHIKGRQPRRIVIDGPLELPETLNVFTDQYEEKTIIVTHNRQKFEQEGDPMLRMLQRDSFYGKTLLVPERESHVDLDEMLKQLAGEGIISILVEPGQHLASAFLRQNLVDKVACFIAPKLLGGGTKAVQGMGIERMNEIMGFRDTSWEQVDSDMLFTGYL